MNREIWYDVTFDAGEAILQGEYSKVTDYANKNRNNLISSSMNELDTTSRTITIGTQTVRMFETKVRKRPDYEAVFRMGQLAGTIDVCAKIEHEKIQDEDIVDMSNSKFSYIAHLDEIIELIGTQGEQNQSAICMELKLGNSTVSMAMPKIINTGLVVKTKVGKSVVYSLSDSGIRYKDILLKQKKNIISRKLLMNSFLEYLAQNPEDNEFLDDVKREIKKSAIIIEKGEMVKEIVKNGNEKSIKNKQFEADYYEENNRNHYVYSKELVSGNSVNLKREEYI